MNKRKPEDLLQIFDNGEAFYVDQVHQLNLALGINYSYRTVAEHLNHLKNQGKLEVVRKSNRTYYKQVNKVKW